MLLIFASLPVFKAEPEENREKAHQNRDGGCDARPGDVKGGNIEIERYRRPEGP